MNLKRWIGMISITCGIAIGVAVGGIDATTSYVGDEMSISDGLLVYRKVTSREGAGFVGIGMTDPKEYLISTPNLGIGGDMRIHGSFSSGVYKNSLNTVDWSKGNNQRLDISGTGAKTITFSNPPEGTAILTLKLSYASDVTGAFTWSASPAAVHWPLGQSPILSTSNSGLTGGEHSDTVFFFYDANRKVYYGVRSYGNGK